MTLRSAPAHRRYLPHGLGGLAVAALGLFLRWGCTTHELPGTATDKTWEHNVRIDAWTRVQDGDWCASVSDRAEIPPVNGQGERAGIRITDTRRKVHHHDRYACGSHPSCSTVNGRRSCHTVTEWCSRPVYRDWCTYDTQKWAKVRTVFAGGGWRDAPTWPSPAVEADQRAVREGRWSAEVRVGEGEDARLLTKALSSEGDYRRLVIGNPVVALVSHFGGLEAIRTLPGDTL